MALLQISEPGAAADPHEARLAVGIDLGTTHSLVATVKSGAAEGRKGRNGCGKNPGTSRKPGAGPEPGKSENRGEAPVLVTR